MTPPAPKAEFHCLDFRRAKLADPLRLPPAAHLHAQACAQCRDFARRVDASERLIARSLALPVPEGLADRVLLRSRQAGAPAWRLAAMVASVVVSVALGLATWSPGSRTDVARFAIQHVMHEPEALHLHRLADTAEFGAVLARFGGELEQPIGTVRYMKLCPVPGGTGWHIVIDTEHGPATLLLIPGRARGEPQFEATMKGWVAAAQAGGKGYYALVTDSPQSLQAIGELLRQRIRWRT